MARRQNKKTLTKSEREARRAKRDEQELAALVQGIAAKYTCSIEVARDFAGQCESRLEDLAFDLDSLSLALEFWSSAPPHLQPVVDLLRELAAEHQRHEQALTRLRVGLDLLADSDAAHEHLEPIERYQLTIRQRLFAPDPAPAQHAQ